jgi:hypothetical protein
MALEAVKAIGDSEVESLGQDVGRKTVMAGSSKCGLFQAAKDKVII